MHVREARFYGRELWQSVADLLNVDLARQRIGERDGRLVLGWIQMRDLGGHCLVEIVTMDIDAQAFAPAIADYLGRRRGARRLCGGMAWEWRIEMIVPPLGAPGRCA